MVTLKDIATQSGVSVSTVSLVLNGRDQELRISPKRATHIRSIAQELDFRPNAAARSMRSQRTRQVGVLIRNALGHEFISPADYETILGINQELDVVGHVVSVVRVTDVVTDRTESRVFSENLLDGIIILGNCSQSTCERIRKLTPHCVWVDGPVWEPQRCIRRNEYDSGRLAVEHLARLGYSRILWVGPNSKKPQSCSTLSHYSIKERHRGVYEQARAWNLPLDHFVLQDNYPKTSYAIEQKVDELIQQLHPHVAVITYDTFLAQRLTHILSTFGKRPSYEFGLVCCDETHEIIHCYPSLSRVSFSRFKMGQHAAKMLIKQLKHPGELGSSLMLRGQWMPGCTALGPNRHGGKNNDDLSALNNGITSPNFTHDMEELTCI